jgi:hypothetical protein
MALLSAGFRYDAGRPSITSPHNIYRYDTLLLVSDSLNGLLVYSVANEKAPRYKTRIPLKGNSGMAMKDSIIYANSWGGILAMRIVNDTDYEVTAVIKDDPYHSGMSYFEGDDYVAMYEGFSCAGGPLGVTEGASVDGSNKGSSGVGGSYAIFAVIDSFLYYMNGRAIVTMDISDAALPRKLSETYVDWSIETLFPTDTYLFIGGSGGMYVMDRAHPSHPTVIGSVTHFRAKDPVVVKDSMAYVTLRVGNDARAFADELMVVNIASVASPKLVKEIPLATPYGLAIADSLLYVAQGRNGWTLFGLSNPQSPVSLKKWTTPDVKDFIWIDNRLYVMCFDKVRIYSVADPQSPVLVAELD